jgi:hypothetical protein
MDKVLRHKASARAQAKKWNAMMVRAKRLQGLKRKGEKLIPTSVLQKLQAMKLPKDGQIYQRALQELLAMPLPRTIPAIGLGDVHAGGRPDRYESGRQFASGVK